MATRGSWKTSSRRDEAVRGHPALQHPRARRWRRRRHRRSEPRPGVRRAEGLGRPRAHTQTRSPLHCAARWPSCPACARAWSRRRRSTGAGPIPSRPCCRARTTRRSPSGARRSWRWPRTNPGLVNVDTDYKERKPQIKVSIDRARAAELGVSLETIGRTLETMLGSRIVTTFVKSGREYYVILQGRVKIARRPPTSTTSTCAPIAGMS